MYCVSFESLYMAMWADHLLGRCLLQTKLVKFLYSFDVCLVVYFGRVTCWAVCSGVWPLSVWNVYKLSFISYRSILQGYKPGFSPVFRGNSIRLFWKFVVLMVMTLWGLGTLQLNWELSWLEILRWLKSRLTWESLGMLTEPRLECPLGHN